MGFTPLEGLMMGTRPGSIDPGILLFLMKEFKLTAQEIDNALNYESGLKAVGGYSDMRELLELQNEERARLAVEMFIHRLIRFIGAMVASLDGVHALTFTAGIGENSPYIRREVCRGLSFLGVDIDTELNESCSFDYEISSPSSLVRVLVLKTREDWMIAQKSFHLIKECGLD
jgi:acetate kinase